MLKVKIWHRYMEDDDMWVSTDIFYGVKEVHFENQEDDNNGLWLCIEFKKGTKNYNAFPYHKAAISFDPKDDGFKIENSNMDKVYKIKPPVNIDKEFWEHYDS